MKIESELKEIILERYGSIREFTIKIDMPYTTFDSILKRGINNAKVENVIKICQELHISADAIGRGEIRPSYLLERTPSDVEEILADTRRRLTSYALKLRGEPADPETIARILDAIDAGVYLAERKK